MVGGLSAWGWKSQGAKNSPGREIGREGVERAWPWGWGWGEQLGFPSPEAMLQVCADIH